MIEPPEESFDWSKFETYSSASKAEIAASFLRSESIPTRVTAHSNLPGQAGLATLWLDRSQFDRARWLLKLPPVTEAELEFLATGEFPKPKDPA
jgi:hypothetical protein